MGRMIPIILSLSLLCACSSSLHGCHIVDKHYEPPHTRMMVLPNANGGMSMIPMYVSEEFDLTIEGKDEKGRVRQKVISVSKETYNNKEIGDEWEWKSE